MPPWILVSNEVGMGLVPTSPLGRVFRDALGRVNQIIAARADGVKLMALIQCKALNCHGTCGYKEVKKPPFCGKKEFRIREETVG
ncbi:MAG: bifunctional adenosylcobinamide kinase/adenosylcobinamide-phosphate guanylyltransferase [Acidimicrobiia bacterium]|nr:bifunctional adenosylcobinamide kinase/adenosylcobinamide-phosphate guanylyltransferase [Acidimicrobiia bacterium]